MNQELAEPTKDYKWQPKKRRGHEEKKGTLRKGDIATEDTIRRMRLVAVLRACVYRAVVAVLRCVWAKIARTQGGV